MESKAKSTIMMVYSKMKSLGSGKIGGRPMMQNDPKDAVKKAWWDDARLFIKVFGKEKAKTLLSDTIYSTDKNL